MPLIGWKFASYNQKHHPDMDKRQNLSAPFSEAISRGIQWWRLEMSAVSSDYVLRRHKKY